ncbi:MAG: hypothetical protein II969_07715 [Anaerolineaceae bacterium]|nr:hypothetical protein [Anaerolineaceae bacterium]
MGSGISGNYSGTSGSSQPYSESYHVVRDMLNHDKADKEIYDPQMGYFRNPTVTLLQDSIDGNRFVINGQSVDGNFTYVLDMDGNIVFGKRSNPNNPQKRAPHPTLIGGRNPQVQCAGIISFRKGKITAIDNQSGHFRPNQESMRKVYSVLLELYHTNPKLFSKNMKWGHEA